MQVDQIPSGYKLTEVGIIPSDWNVVKLKDISEKIMVGIASAATHAYRKEGIILFRNQNIKPGYLNDQDILYIDEEYESYFKNKRLKAGDLLIARTGYPGTACVVPQKYENTQSFTTLITRPNQQLVSTDFLCYYINSDKGKSFFESNKIGGGQKNINVASLVSMPIVFPPIEEQKRIAQVLSDIDELIRSLDELIIKKRNIKQGTMQLLLTGKQRLPGYSGEWYIKDLGNIAPLQRGFDLPNHQLKKGIYPVAYSNGILNYHSEFKVKGPGVVTGRSGTIGKVSYILENYWPHNTSLWVTDFKENNPLFVYYLYTSIHLEKFAIGSGVPTLNRNDVHSLKIPIPPLEEQKAIARILSDMDEEIEVLEQKRDKYQDIKKGMMQELLTGKTRLV